MKFTRIGILLTFAITIGAMPIASFAQGLRNASDRETTVDLLNSPPVGKLQQAANIETDTSRILISRPEFGLHIDGQNPTTYIENYANETPRVIVEWIGPETIVKDQAAEFRLLVRNRGSAAVEQVEISQAIPQGFELIEAKPAPTNAENRSWSIPRLAPDGQAIITLTLKPNEVGNAQCDALVRYTTASRSLFRVVQPLLKVETDVTKSVLLGSEAICNINISNPGSGPLEDVIVKVNWSEGFVPGEAQFEIPKLNAGEIYPLRVLANARKLGPQICKVEATAKHGLHGESISKIIVLGAELLTEIDGPAFRYVNRPAEYVVKVKNTGTAEATNTQLGVVLPKSMLFEQASANGKFDANVSGVYWALGTLAPGAETTVTCRVITKDRGDFTLRSRAQADRGVRHDNNHDTRVEGIAAMLVEAVDSDDPIEVGANSLYEVVATNQGTDFATNVEMLLDIPAEMQIVGVKGPVDAVQEGQKLKFVIPRLAPRADAVFRVQVKALKVGDARLQVSVKSDTLESPVIEQESTKIYKD